MSKGCRWCASHTCARQATCLVHPVSSRSFLVPSGECVPFIFLAFGVCISKCRFFITTITRSSRLRHIRISRCHFAPCLQRCESAGLTDCCIAQFSWLESCIHRPRSAASVYRPLQDQSMVLSPKLYAACFWLCIVVLFFDLRLIPFPSLDPFISPVYELFSFGRIFGSTQSAMRTKWKSRYFRSG